MKQQQEYKHAKDRDGIVYVHGTINGNRHRLSTDKKATATNLKWVENNWRKVIEELVSNESHKKLVKSMTVDEYMPVSFAKNKRADLTAQDYLGMYNLHIKPIFGNIALNELKASDLGIWQTKLLEKLSGDRVHNIRTVFRGILKDAIADKHISENLFDNVKGVKKGEPVIQPFFLDEMKMIIENTDGFFKQMVIVAFFTGMRTGELIALEWGDINFKNKTISIKRARRNGKLGPPKNGTTREIDMLPIVEEALREQEKLTREKGKDVFISSRGEGYKSSKTLTKNYWHPLIEKCKLEKRDFYNTRHSFATLMISNNEDILWIAHIMGHKDPTVTFQKYTKYRKNTAIKRATFLDDAFVIVKS